MTSKAKRAAEPIAAAFWIPISSLHEWARNPRLNDGQPVEKVAKSIRQFGFVSPICVWQSAGRMVAGHTRLKAMRAILAAEPDFVPKGAPGAGLVPVRFHEFADEAEADAYALADNRLAEEADWHREALADVMSSLAERTELLDAAGYDRADLAEFFPAPGEDGPEPDDEEGPTFSEPGTTYELGPHRLYVGDSSIVQREFGAGAKLQIADPPFDVPYAQWRVLDGVDVVGVWFRSKDALAWILSEMGGPEWGMHMLVFTGGVRGQHNHTLPCCMHENVAVLRRHWWTDKHEAIDRDVIRASGCKATSAPDYRPISWQEHSGGVVAAQSIGMSWAKPLMQMEMLVAYVPAGSLVWDPCAGSGSSLLAAAKHGRMWRGCEMQPKHADLVRRRWTRWASENDVEVGSGGLE